MKKIICALLACSMCVVTAAGLSGCGCNDNKSNPSSGSVSQNKGPGYEIPATEPDLQDESFGYYIINSEELMVTKYFGNDKDVVVPETFKNYKVTIIGHSVFNSGDYESITIPDTVTEIQDYCFACSTHLKTVKLSGNLKTLGSNAFFMCSALEEIELPASLKTLGVYSFCASGLKSITIPESSTLTGIDAYTFYQCPNLKEAVIPPTITNIADNAFEDCPSDLVIKGYPNTYVLSYAKQNGLKSEEITNE